MSLQAEIQKHQQSVSDLKRQVEQITALAGEDKKAGIRVADALRKRKIRASMKDVKIHDPADIERCLANSADIERCLANSADIYAFLSCYFPDVFWGDWTEQTVLRQMTRRVGPGTRRVVELACGTLVAYVLFLLGRNFFYETPWLGKPLLGTGFLVQAVFWILAAALALRWALLRRLAQGLDQTLAELVGRLSAEPIAQGLFAEFDEASCAIERHAQQLGAIEQQVVQLRQRLAQVEDVPLGRLIESDAGTFVPP